MTQAGDMFEALWDAEVRFAQTCWHSSVMLLEQRLTQKECHVLMKNIIEYCIFALREYIAMKKSRC